MTKQDFQNLIEEMENLKVYNRDNILMEDDGTIIPAVLKVEDKAFNCGIDKAISFLKEKKKKIKRH